MEWIKNHYKTILSSLLTLVLVCSMAFLMPTQKAQAKELKSTTVEISPFDFYIVAFNNNTGATKRIDPNNNGLIIFSADSDAWSFVIVCGYSEADIPLDSQSGIAVCHDVYVDLSFDVVFDNSVMAGYSPVFSDVRYVDIYVPQGNRHSDVTWDFYTTADSNSVGYSCSVSATAPLEEGNLSDFASVACTFEGINTLYPYNPDPANITIRPLGGELTFTYTVLTPEDVLNDALLNGDSELDSSLSSDREQNGNDVSNIIDFDEDLEAKIDSVYADYGVDPDNMTDWWKGLVIQIDEVAIDRSSDASIIQVLWDWLREYHVLYLFTELGLLLAFITFLMRR